MSPKRTLKRSVGLRGAILLGLGSILGTGVFVSLGLAVGIAGVWALPALGLAGLLAVFNALSSAQLAASHPVSGGTYAYGYRYLNPELGFTAGLCFLLAKSASAAAASMGLAGYAGSLLGLSDVPTNVLASGFVLIMTLLVASGLKRASLVNGVLVIAALISLLALIVFAGLRLDPSDVRLWQMSFAPKNFLEAAAFLFVAFTGYGRIATLGEEVKEPRKTIPKAIIVTLLISSGLYLGVLYAGISVLGVDEFAAATLETSAPLQAMAAQLQVPGLRLFVAIGAIMAMAGVLLNLILGLSRVAFSMGREGDLPSRLSRISLGQEPLVAVWSVGLFIALLAFFGGLKAVWGFSAFAVLCYYAITNVAALRLSREERLYPRIIPVLGLCGCLGLAVWISLKTIIAGLMIVAAGLLTRYFYRQQK
ncbi:MAG: APC family permease [Alphaproteobacteria bacterium]